jgi:hypothetical protein
MGIIMIMMIMGMTMSLVAAAIFTTSATFMFFLVMNNHLAGIRANFQPLAADHIDMLPWQDGHSHQVSKGLSRIRCYFGDALGMNKDVTTALILLGHGRGQRERGFRGKLPGDIDMQVPVALISLNAVYCFHVISPFDLYEPHPSSRFHSGLNSY